MITAEEARELVKEVNESSENVSDNIDEIYELIEESCNQGCNFIIYLHDITKDIKEELEENGYRLFIFKNQAVVVYWG